MSDEPIIASSFAGKDSDEFFIQAARACCEMSIKNTGVGKWLGQSLDRLETAKAELLTAEQTGHKWFKKATQRRFEIERLQTENARLRDTLKRVKEATDE
jgi:hypothetical protein